MPACTTACITGLPARWAPRPADSLANTSPPISSSRCADNPLASQPSRAPVGARPRLDANRCGISPSHVCMHTEQERKAMKQKRLITTMAATFAAAALYAAPTWSQTSSSSSTGSDTGSTSSTTGGMGSSAAAGVNDPSRYDSGNTHLNANCTDTTTGITRTTGDCAVTGGTGLGSPGTSSSIGTSNGLGTSSATSGLSGTGSSATGTSSGLGTTGSGL